MNSVMNPKIVDAVKTKMQADGITQTALAERMGIERTNLVRIVNGHIGTVPKRWQQLLDELGLELVVVPKGTDLSKLDREA